MSNKKKRNKRKRPPRRAQNDCCILCQLYGQADAQDKSWSVSDRADELAARMRATQEWDRSFEGLIRSPSEGVTAFVNSWAELRMPLDDSATVAVAALLRFWGFYHREEAPTA